jgi:hypothetical protein
MRLRVQAFLWARTLSWTQLPEGVLGEVAVGVVSHVNAGIAETAGDGGEVCLRGLKGGKNDPSSCGARITRGAGLQAQLVW